MDNNIIKELSEQLRHVNKLNRFYMGMIEDLQAEICVLRGCAVPKRTLRKKTAGNVIRIDFRPR